LDLIYIKNKQVRGTRAIAEPIHDSEVPRTGWAFGEQGKKEGVARRKINKERIADAFSFSSLPVLFPCQTLFPLPFHSP
jgi:hypothetical protein